MNAIQSRYVAVVQKIYWFAYLQMLWFLFTLIGCIVLGVFPATHALIVALKEENLSSREAFSLFKHIYSTSFLKLSSAGLLFKLIFILIAINLVILQSMYIKIIVLCMLGLVLLSSIHFLQYFNFRKPIIFQMKTAFSLVWLLPRNNLGYVCVFFLLIVAISFMPGLTFFFGVSITMLGIVKIGNSKESQRLTKDLI